MFKIEKELKDGISNYLIEMKYKEVNQLMSGLSQTGDTIELDLLKALITYLSTKKYNEVVRLIDGLIEIIKLEQEQKQSQDIQE